MAFINTSRYPNRKYSIQEDSTNSEAVEIRVQEYRNYYPINTWDRSQLAPGNGTPFGAVFIVVNAALGAGLLSFPLAFYQAGGFAQGIAIELVCEYTVLSEFIMMWFHVVCACVYALVMASDRAVTV